MDPSHPGSALAKTSNKKGGGGKRITSETSPSSSSSSSGQIVVPTLSDRDVMLGRGGDVQNRPGNQFFRSLVNQHAQAYADLPPGEKPQIAFLIVSTVRQQGGRFLKVKPQKKSSRKKQQPQQEIYLDIGEKEALSKTSQALRSATHRLRKRKRPGDVDYNESSSSSTEQDEEETKISSRSLQQQQQPQQSVASMDRGPTTNRGSTPARSIHAAAAASPATTAAAAAASPMSSTLPQDSATAAAATLRPLTDPVPGEPQEIAFLLQRATHFRNLALQDEQRALTLRSLLRQQQSQDRVQAPTPSWLAFATQDSALLPSVAGNNLLLSTLFPDSFGSTQVSTEERILQQLSNQTASSTTGLEDLLSRNPLFQSTRDPSSQHPLLSPQDSLLARLAGLPSVAAATSGSLSLEQQQQQLLQAARLMPQERSTTASSLSSLLSPSDQQLLASLSGGSVSSSLPQQQQPQLASLASNQQQAMGVTGRDALLQHLLMSSNNTNAASLQDLLSQHVAGVPDGESKLGEQQQQQSEARWSSGSTGNKRPRRG